MGKIYNSKYRSGPYIEMHRKLLNENKIRNNNPGPGAYLTFSEFGMWVPKNSSKTIRASQKRMNTENKTDDNIKKYFKKLMEKKRKQKI